MMTGVGTEKNAASATFAPVHESVWCLGCLDVAMKPPSRSWANTLCK